MAPKGRSPSKGGKRGRAKKPATSSGKKKAKPPTAGDDDAAAVEPEVVDDDLLAEAALDEEDLEAIDVGAAARANKSGAGENLPVPADPAGALVPRDSLSTYLAEVGRYPVLSREEEHELAVHYYETGDPAAAARLITSNLRLVVMVAREYQRAFHNLLDLIQEGNVGLLEAVKKFDPYRGVRLPSYAVWWIRAYVIRYVMNNFRLVKVGTTQAQRRLFFNLRKEKARLEAEGFAPTTELIAERLGVKESEVIEMDQRMGGGAEVSADAPVGSEGDTRMVDLLPNESSSPDDEVADREFFGLMRAKLIEFAETLEGREKEIYTERLVAEQPVTLQELGERYGVSRERVRQIEEALKLKLREFLVAEIRISPDEILD